MLQHPLRGPGRGSFITGRSVHNSRIERLWRDLHEQVVISFANIFRDFESRGILDPDNELHIFCLHAVYLPRINHLIQSFVDMWNNHKIRTASNKTPLQLFLMGLHVRRGTVISNEYFEHMSEERAQDYGIDPNGPIHVDEDYAEVVVPDTLCQLTEAQVALFNQQFNIPDNHIADMWGDESYLRALDIVQNLTEN